MAFCQSLIDGNLELTVEFSVVISIYKVHDNLD